MTPIAIAEVLDGKVIAWMKKGANEEYLADSKE
jgi:hypothetical protein